MAIIALMWLTLNFAMICGTFFCGFGPGGAHKSVGPGMSWVFLFGTFSEMGRKMLPKWQSYTGYIYRSLSKQCVKYVSYMPGN